MELTGSCHCGSVYFTLHSRHPYPFNRCYCSICRKTAGGGGYAINLGGDFKTLTIQGKQHLKVYRAKVEDPQTGSKQTSLAQRNFCKNCGSALWIWDPRWPDLIHPFASAIDTELPIPPERTHMMLSSKAAWVQIQTDPKDQEFDDYPTESLADWHRRLGLEDHNYQP
jgi:hypothetical protein